MKLSWIFVCLIITGCISSLEQPNIPVSNIPVSVQSKTNEMISNLSQADTSFSNLLYTYAGVSLFILGAMTSAFWNKKSGLILILCGLFAGAIPFVINSIYFAWISAGTLLSLAICGIWWVRWKVKHEAQQEEQEDKNNL